MPPNDGPGLLLDDEARDALGRLGRQRDEAGPLAVGDPHLRAVEDVLVAVGRRLAAQRLRVAAGVGLGQRERAAHLARRHPRQVAAALLVGAEPLDQGGGDRVRVEHAGQRHPAVRQLLHEPGVRQRRRGRARRTPRGSWRRTARTPSSARPSARGTRSACSYSDATGMTSLRTHSRIVADQLVGEGARPLSCAGIVFSPPCGRRWWLGVAVVAVLVGGVALADTSRRANGARFPARRTGAVPPRDASRPARGAGAGSGGRTRARTNRSSPTARTTWPRCEPDRHHAHRFDPSARAASGSTSGLPTTRAAPGCC